MIRDLDVTTQSTIAQTASHCFDISVWQFFAALISGARTIIYSDKLVRQPPNSPPGWIAIVSRTCSSFPHI